MMNLAIEQVGCDKVLVVDDDPEERFATCRILRKAGYEVEEANSGPDAIDKVRETTPDLLLLDVVMPGMDGFETCRTIKADRHFDEVFVVLISSYKTTPEHQAKGLDAGADGFICRPYHSAEFVSRIRSMMRIKAAEKELRLQRQWLRVTLSSIGDALIATDDEERILFMNSVAEELTGWTIEEASRKRIGEVFDIVDGTTERPVMGPVGRVLKEGSVILLDDNTLLVAKNRQRKSIADSAAPIRDEAGKVTGAVLVFRDVTEKRLSDEKLSEAVRNWEAVFAAIGQMALIIDPHHGVVDANDVALAKTGFAREQIIGKKCFEILHGATRPPPDCPMVKALASGYQESGATPLQSLEGEYLVSCTPVRGAKGDIARFIHIATDISDLRQVEKELVESEQKYRMLFKSASDAIFLVDVETLDILDANESASMMYDYDLREFSVLKATDLSSEIDRTIEAIMLGSPTEIPIRYHRKKDGTVFPVEVASVFFPLKGRRVVLASVRDISQRLRFEQEREALEMQLRQSQKLEAIGTLASGIAHDFNNILSSIMGFSELSLDMVEKGSDLEDNLLEIHAGGERAKDLVKQILTFARRTPEQKAKPIRVGPIAEEVTTFLRSSLPKSVELSCHVECDSLVLADPSQVHQVLMNLCANASQAMEKEGGELTLHVSGVNLDESYNKVFPELMTGDYVKVTVSDTGPGIPEDIRDSVFEPYFTTRESGEGTGLGLAMVHGIVKRHQGHIRVRSRLGEGTSFDVYLPVTDQPAEERQYVEGDLPEGNERILLVDDEPPVAKMGAQILGRLGYHVTKHTSSSEALEAFRTAPDDFDLVITDLTMPELSGERFAAEVKRIRPDIPVVLCTGYGKKISDERAREIGIAALVQKPFARSELAGTVREVLDAVRGDR